jgi:hypothetical protein
LHSGASDLNRRKTVASSLYCVSKCINHIVCTFKSLQRFTDPQLVK